MNIRRPHLLAKIIVCFIIWIITIFILGKETPEYNYLLEIFFMIGATLLAIGIDSIVLSYDLAGYKCVT